MAWTAEQNRIHRALGVLMTSCGYAGESGTERLFGVLFEAIINVSNEWEETVGQSHRDGLFYDVNALLTDAIIEAIKAQAEPGERTGVQ